MPSSSRSTHETVPEEEDPADTSCDAVTLPLEASATYTSFEPRAATRYALPVAGATLSGPILSILPLGPLGPSLGLLAAAYSRYKLRQSVYYALMHSTSLEGVRDHLSKLASSMSESALYGITTAKAYFSSLIASTRGATAPALSLVANLLGGLGILAGFVASKAATMLPERLRSLAVFKRLGCTLKQAEQWYHHFLGTLKNTYLPSAIQRASNDNADTKETQKDVSIVWKTVQKGLRKVSLQQPAREQEALDEWEILDDDGDDDDEEDDDSNDTGEFDYGRETRSVASFGGTARSRRVESWIDEVEMEALHGELDDF